MHGNIITFNNSHYSYITPDIGFSKDLISSNIEPVLPQQIGTISQTCATKFERITMFPLVVTATIVPIVTIGILLILLVTVFICLASHRHRKRKANQQRLSLEGSNQFVTCENGAQRENIILRHNASYLQSDSIHKGRQNVIQMVEMFTSHRASNITESYVISSLGQAGNAEPYWDPACKEEDLKQQLGRLKVEEVRQEEIQ